MDRRRIPPPGVAGPQGGSTHVPASDGVRDPRPDRRPRVRGPRSDPHLGRASASGTKGSPAGLSVFHPGFAGQQFGIVGGGYPVPGSASPYDYGYGYGAPDYQGYGFYPPPRRTTRWGRSWTRSEGPRRVAAAGGEGRELSWPGPNRPGGTGIGGSQGDSREAGWIGANLARPFPTPYLERDRSPGRLLAPWGSPGHARGRTHERPGLGRLYGQAAECRIRRPGRLPASRPLAPGLADRLRRRLGVCATSTRHEFGSLRGRPREVTRSGLRPRRIRSRPGSMRQAHPRSLDGTDPAR